MPETEFNQLRSPIFSAARQDYQQGIRLIDELLLQRQTDLTLEQQIRLLYSKADYLHSGNQTANAMTILAQTKAMSLESADPAILYSYHNIIAGIFRDLGLFAPAIAHFRQAMEKSKFLQNELYVRQTENNLGLLLIQQKQFAEANRYFQQFYQYGIQTQDPSVQSIALNNLGQVALEQGDIAKAGILHRQALALRSQFQITHHLPWSLLNLAKVAKAEQDWPTVLILARESLQLRQQNLAQSQLEPGLLLAEAYQRTGDTKAATAQLQQSLALATRLQAQEWLLQAWQLQSDFYQQQQQPELAVLALRQVLLAQQKLAQQRFDISLAQSSAELGLKSREAELQKARQAHEQSVLAAAAQRQRLWFGIGAALLVLLLTLGFSLNIRRKNQALAQSLDHLQRTRRQLVEAEKMAALTSLVTGMAHQLNTPLGTVLTAVTCSNDQLRGLQSKLAQKTLTATELQQGLQDNCDLLQLAEQSTDRAAELVQRFKLISAQFDQAEAEAINLQQYLPALMHSLLQGFHPASPVTFSCQGDAVTLYSYPAQLDKIFSALTENALIHGLSQHPDPRISLHWQVLHQPDQPAQLQLRFADNGTGIPADQAERIFDPFYSTKLGQGHLGLGLNIVFNTLQQLAGHIQRCPPEPTPAPPQGEPATPATGCCFILTLPLDCRQSTPKHHPTRQTG